MWSSLQLRDKCYQNQSPQAAGDCSPPHSAFSTCRGSVRSRDSHAILLPWWHRRTPCCSGLSRQCWPRSNSLVRRVPQPSSGCRTCAATRQPDSKILEAQQAAGGVVLQLHGSAICAFCAFEARSSGYEPDAQRAWSHVRPVCKKVNKHRQSHSHVSYHCWALLSFQQGVEILDDKHMEKLQTLRELLRDCGYCAKEILELTKAGGGDKQGYGFVMAFCLRWPLVSAWNPSTFRDV